MRNQQPFKHVERSVPTENLWKQTADCTEWMWGLRFKVAITETIPLRLRTDSENLQTQMAMAVGPLPQCIDQLEIPFSGYRLQHCNQVPTISGSRMPLHYA